MNIWTIENNIIIGILNITIILWPKCLVELEVRRDIFISTYFYFIFIVFGWKKGYFYEFQSVDHKNV